MNEILIGILIVLIGLGIVGSILLIGRSTDKSATKPERMESPPSDNGYSRRLPYFSDSDKKLK